MARMARTPANAVSAPPPQPASKTALVLDLMRRAQGATLEDMTVATGWQSHSTRAVLTGLRKKGHAILREKRGDVSCYRLAETA